MDDPAKTHVWVEYCFGSSKNRGQLFKARDIWMTSLKAGFEGSAFHSSFFFTDELKAYVEEHKEVDDKGNEKRSLRGYRGVHWAPFFTLDIDSRRETVEVMWDARKKRWAARPESERDEWRKAHEDEKPDPEFARKDAMEVLRVLRDFGVDSNKVLICFTGNKGFHLKVPTAYFTPEPCDNFAQRIRAIVEKCIWPKIDTKVMPHPEACIDWQIYNHLHVIRAINSVHEKSKLFKIPLTHDELCSIDIEAIRRLAEGPRAPWRKPRWDDIEVTEPLRKAWEDSAAWVKERSEKFATEGRIHHRLDLIVSKEALAPRRRLCAMKLLGEDAGSGNRNPVLLMLASDFRDMGMTPEQTFGLLRPWLKLQAGSHHTEEDLLTQVRYVYGPNFNWGCSHPIAMASCFMECHLYPQAKVEREMSDQWNTLDHYLQKLYDRMKRPRYYSFPYGRLARDIRIWGKQVFLLVGETATGKTALAMDFMEANGRELNRKREANPDFVGGIGFFSLEMPGEEIAERAAQRIFQQDQSMIEGIFTRQIAVEATGVENADMSALRQHIAARYANVRIFDETAPDIQGLHKLCAAAKKVYGMNLFVVDFADRMKARGINSYERIAPIATGLKDIVKDLDITIVMLAQVGRSNAEKGVGLRSARGSGQWEENVDGMITMARGTKASLGELKIELPDDEFAIHRPYRYVIVTAEKNRSGPEKGKSLQKFYGATMSFETVILPDHDTPKASSGPEDIPF